MAAVKPNIPEGPSVIPPAHIHNTHLSSSLAPETPASFRPALKCGPLIRYHGADYSTNPERPLWRGSVLIVTESECVPRFGLEVGLGQQTGRTPALSPGLKLFDERGRAFWRFAIEVGMVKEEQKVEYIVSFGSDKVLKRTFWIPGMDDSMRIMFHSCNGFSVGTDEADYSGPALWNDVLRIHSEHPFHVSIGGGDQIYNDGIRVTGPLKDWASLASASKKRIYQWSEQLEADADEWYFNNYVDWYSTAPYSHANSQIPSVNIWDDHDIIDGYGSYTDRFMSCAVFKGVGKTARKYYMLFQHHTPPAGEEKEDPCWVIGKTPGRYIGDTSRSVYARLGKRIGFIGVDARSERTRHMINEPETYDLLFERMNCEVEEAAGDIRHMVILLGVPIAYPRLVWLENILQSPLFGFIRFLNKRFGAAGAIFNKFDGQVDILDDLDDHYCARPHKEERNAFLLRLQQFSLEKQVRITMLSGDVHLAAIGRFYSKPELNIPTANDHRYMVNVISSAITNKPPPEAVSNILARRNKVHHLDGSTDEQLLDFFNKDVHGKPRQRNMNTMPSRNYSVITESPIVSSGTPNIDAHPKTEAGEKPKRKKTNTIGAGEHGAGADHPAATAEKVVETIPGALNVVIRVEIDQHQPDGETFSYGFTIPALEAHA
ncbi:hypothetical protein DFP73DRAFT_590185 [Morchella snyderi]|nr:hypothetical protein DFP73DRAFT_590185 [Morchella snyderi]